MPASITPSLQLAPGEKFTLTLNPIQSSSGGPGQLADGIVPVWSVDNPVAVRLGPTEDGLRCLVFAVGLGNAIITCSSRGVSPTPPDVIATVTVANDPAALPPADQTFLTASTPVVA